ncbi:MAG: hypothetical protein WC812_01155 [Candidatus Pacearchaeota archaeon]|jgi:uncharacterized protein YjgD (DUF1641 family)
MNKNMEMTDKEYQKALEHLIEKDDGFKFLADEKSFKIPLIKIFEKSDNLKIFYSKTGITSIEENILKLIGKKETNITLNAINNSEFGNMYAVIGDEKRCILFYKTTPKIFALVSFNNKKICKNIEQQLN